MNNNLVDANVEVQKQINLCNNSLAPVSNHNEKAVASKPSKYWLRNSQDCTEIVDYL
jgi:hypothetical protein